MGSLIVSLPLVALHLETVDRSAAADLERVKGGRPSSCAVTRIRGPQRSVNIYNQHLFFTSFLWMILRQCCRFVGEPFSNIREMCSVLAD